MIIIRNQDSYINYKNKVQRLGKAKHLGMQKYRNRIHPSQIDKRVGSIIERNVGEQKYNKPKWGAFLYMVTVYKK